ncbi:replication-relaxation family protein [Thermogemmatispora sp.]|uniref:replication-relaxation family protein n=1 Tax=Thermogemmatispora sp. TaxID=1968838 RepID=UPI0035E40D95
MDPQRGRAHGESEYEKRKGGEKGRESAAAASSARSQESDSVRDQTTRPLAGSLTGSLEEQLLVWLLAEPWQRLEDLQTALGCSHATLVRMHRHLKGLLEVYRRGTGWYLLSPAGLLAAAERVLGFRPSNGELHHLARACGYSRRQLQQQLLALESWLPCQQLLQELLTRWVPLLQARVPHLSCYWVWAWKRLGRGWPAGSGLSWPWAWLGLHQEPRAASGLLTCRATAVLLLCALPTPDDPDTSPDSKSAQQSEPEKEKGKRTAPGTRFPLLLDLDALRLRLRFRLLSPVGLEPAVAQASQLGSRLLSRFVAPLVQGGLSLHIPIIVDSGLSVSSGSRLQRLLVPWLLLQCHSSRCAALDPDSASASASASATPITPAVGPLLLLIREGVGPASSTRRYQVWHQALLDAWQQVQLLLGDRQPPQLPPVWWAVIPERGRDRDRDRDRREASWQLPWRALWDDRPCPLSAGVGQLAVGPWFPDLLPPWWNWWGRSHSRDLSPTGAPLRRSGESGERERELAELSSLTPPAPDDSPLSCRDEDSQDSASSACWAGSARQGPWPRHPRRSWLLVPPSLQPFRESQGWGWDRAEPRRELEQQVLLSSLLDRRHRALMRLLFHLPGASRDLLTHASPARPQTIARRLRELARWGVIHPLRTAPGTDSDPVCSPRTPPESVSDPGWHLTGLGWRLLAAWSQESPGLLARRQRRQWQQGLSLHQGALLRLLALWLQAAQALAPHGHHLIWWEVNPSSPWLPLHSQHQLVSRPPVRPDLVFLYRTPGPPERQMLICCELDRATMSRPALQSKWNRYRTVALSSQGRLWLAVITLSQRARVTLEGQLLALAQRGWFPGFVIRLTDLQELEAATALDPASLLVAPLWTQVAPAPRGPVAFLDPP